MSKFKVGDKVVDIANIEYFVRKIEGDIYCQVEPVEGFKRASYLIITQNGLKLVQPKSEFDLSKCPRNAEGHWLCQTRSGKAVRILARDVEGANKLLGLVSSETVELVNRWSEDGKSYGGTSDNPYDLLNLPQKIEGWVTVHRRNGDGSYFYSDLLSSQEEVKKNKFLYQPLATLVAVLPQSITIGDGLTDSERSKL